MIGGVRGDGVLFGSLISSNSAPTVTLIAGIVFHLSALALGDVRESGRGGVLDTGRGEFLGVFTSLKAVLIRLPKALVAPELLRNISARNDDTDSKLNNEICRNKIC